MTDFSQYMEKTVEALLGKAKTRKGDKWRYGNNGSLSVDIAAGRYYDHENECGGGVLDLIMRETSAATVKAAVSWLEEQNIKQKEQPERKKQASKMVKAYDYADENGEIRYQVCRMEPKNFLQRKPAATGSGWDWKVKGVTPLPYHLPAIIAGSDRTIIITEGEKDADLLHSIGLLATCNSGGAGKFDKALVPWFKGRKVVITPDNDEAGRKHAEIVAASLSGVADSVRVVTLPGLEEKQDVSDWVKQGNTKEDLIKLVQATEEWEPRVVEPEPAVTEPEPERWGQPLRALGYNGSAYYYLPRGTEQVCEIKRSAHTSPSELMSMAPLEWWCMAYPKEGSLQPDWLSAGNDLMRRCDAKGIYSHDKERGRGAWFDKGRSVLHLGNRLLVDGQEVRISDHNTDYIYTKQPPLENGTNATQATNDESSAIANLFDQLNWAKPIHSQLLAGWCVLAPICGSMQWRPHVWLTAQRGAGKSWIQDNIIGPLLGPSALMVQGSTTEAGIRQKLKQDARPIVFDEAESEDQRSQGRMQTVIELARQSSSDSTAEIIKGTVNGNGMAFRMRSMFLLGSVNVSLSQAADESRFSVLTLLTPEKTNAERERFEKFSKDVHNTLTDDASARIRARSYKLLPIIRINAKTFSKAVAELIGSQRIGDQIGTLIAGAFSLYRETEITIEEARIWVNGLDFSDAKEAEEVSDEDNCIARIMQHQVRFMSEKGTIERSIGELIECANRGEMIDGIDIKEANKVLSRHGLKVVDSCIYISNSHLELVKILKDSPWGKGWKRILSRIEGAEKPKNPVKFAGSCSRFVKIPIANLK